jgi:hypothetical protein
VGSFEFLLDHHHKLWLALLYPTRSYFRNLQSTCHQAPFRNQKEMTFVPIRRFSPFVLRSGGWPLPIPWSTAWSPHLQRYCRWHGRILCIPWDSRWGPRYHRMQQMYPDQKCQAILVETIGLRGNCFTSSSCWFALRSLKWFVNLSSLSSSLERRRPERLWLGCWAWDTRSLLDQKYSRTSI